MAQEGNLYETDDPLDLDLGAYARGGRGVLAGQDVQTIPHDSKNVIQFSSQASLETIIGHTSEVAGSVELDAAHLTAAARGSFEVDLTTFDTGIGMRNQHMRENYLETAKHP